MSDLQCTNWRLDDRLNRVGAATSDCCHLRRAQTHGLGLGRSPFTRILVPPEFSLSQRRAIFTD